MNQIKQTRPVWLDSRAFNNRWKTTNAKDFNGSASILSCSFQVTLISWNGNWPYLVSYWMFLPLLTSFTPCRFLDYVSLTNSCLGLVLASLFWLHSGMYLVLLNILFHSEIHHITEVKKKKKWNQVSLS